MTNPKLERLVTKHDCGTKKFYLHDVPRNYTKQFSHLYNQRLSKIRECLKKQSIKVWGDGVKVLDKIIDTETNPEDNVDECVIIGTIYKEMVNRVSAVDEFKDATQVSDNRSLQSNITSKYDTIVLEDETGRIQLTGKMISLIPLLVTGVCVAVKGKETTLGIFEASDYVFMNGRFNHDTDTETITCCRSLPDTTTTITTTLSPSYQVQHHKSSYAHTLQTIDPSLFSTSPSFILLISNLQVGNVHETTSTLSAEELNICRHNLFDFLSGQVGNSVRDIQLASRITRVILAGNSVNSSSTYGHHAKDRYTTIKQQIEIASPMKQLDILLAPALVSCPIDIMPGKEDPANLSLPQQPLHPCLFPHSSRYNTLNLVTNPYECHIDDVLILGHSGQPVDDILRQTHSLSTLDKNSSGNTDYDSMQIDPTSTTTNTNNNNNNNTATMGSEQDKENTVPLNEIDAHHNDSVHVLQHTLKWGHLCPTAPDTLACHPYTHDDPFIISSTSSSSENLPRIFFAGCQNKFETILETHNDGSMTRYISVPSFYLTQEVVLVDIHTLQYQVLRFKYTLACHPYTHDDPFIISSTSSSENLPRIFFAGCQNKFETILETHNDGSMTRYISVPSFHLTQEAVLVDIHTLQYQVLRFKCNV